MRTKKKVIFLGLAMAGLVSTMFARELRTPWALWHGPQHAPIPWPVDEDSCWHYNTWFGAERKQSNKVLIDKNSAESEPLAGVIFGKPSFVALDAFAPETISPANPFLAVAQITPQYCYNENSAWFGLTAERIVGCDCTWRIGGRAILPFRAIKTELTNCCDVEETLQDMCAQQNDRLDGAPFGLSNAQTVLDCYSYRLDFVSALYVTQAGLPPHEPAVKYANPDKNDRITFFDSDVTNGNPDGPILYVTQRDNETRPEGAFCEAQPIIEGFPILSADGTGLANNDRAQFGSGTNYTPLGSDVAQQRQLWIGPAVENVVGSAEMVLESRIIGDRINQIVRNLNQTALDFLKANGVDIGTQKLNGTGMLNTELYFNHDFCKGFLEGWVGVQWPTGIRVKNPGQVLKIFTTGNNHHYEFRFGGVATWNPACWFAFKVDALYAHAFKARERVAAAFKGATVKNIGPAINSDISWNYLFGHASFNFFNPCNPRTGVMFGYEWYTKFKDKVRFDQTTATDFLGNTRELDPNVLEFRTDVVSHKGMVELFHQGDFWELFGGWTSVFAGKNAPKESDWYIGFVTYF